MEHTRTVIIVVKVDQKNHIHIIYVHTFLCMYIDYMYMYTGLFLPGQVNVNPLSAVNLSLTASTKDDSNQTSSASHAIKIVTIFTC